MRRFGNRRPRLGVVFITDWWGMARDNREKLSYCTLVVEPFVEPNLDACNRLDVIVVMHGDSRLVMKALRRAKPNAVHVCAPMQYLNWLEWMVAHRAQELAA